MRMTVLTNTSSLVVDWLTKTFFKEIMIVMNDFFQSSHSPYALWYTLAAGTKVTESSNAQHADR
ncbi:MAG: hypothetical protein ACT4PN_16685 [Nitrospiraceae bacterium]